jgi:G3E family GTPase
LGSGKTTLLTQLLQNKQGLKVAVVVNDVASVNIDSKLVKQNAAVSTEDGTVKLSDGLVELQNGCACCSLSDELLNSVSELVTLSQLRDGPEGEGGFQHIVIELSGVADPKQVRAKFQEAALAGMPLMDHVQLDTMVTVVDASMFESYFKSAKTASRKETPELFYVDGQAPEENEEEFEQEEWMKDMPPKLLEAVMASIRGTSLEDESNGVAELLVSQTETADIVVLNKCDLVDGNKDMERLQEIVSALNPRASIQQTTFGQVPLQSILGVAKGEGVAVSGAVDDHREYVSAAMQVMSPVDDVCTSPGCTDPSHSHSHHGHDNEQTSSHSHSHNHDLNSHSHDHDCSDSTSTDESHSHSHSHSHKEEAPSCADPNCNDPNHSHVHSHQSSDRSTHAGIGTFVYRARRPFHPGRLVTFLRYLPVVRGIPGRDEDDDNLKENQVTVSSHAEDTLKSTLRAKGFCWCADSHDSAMYMSQAGSSFELMCLGQWWATLPRSQWPEGIEDYVFQDFDDPSHDDSKSNDAETVGDRRQEVVFIGPNFDSPSKQGEIQATLDQCLLSQEEYDEYKRLRGKETELQIRFSNSMESKYVNF